jgi:hypothetical protein
LTARPNRDRETRLAGGRPQPLPQNQHRQERRARQTIEVRDGKKRDIGRGADAFSLKFAREKRDQILPMLAHGLDPIAERKKEREEKRGGSDKESLHRLRRRGDQGARQNPMATFRPH